MKRKVILARALSDEVAKDDIHQELIEENVVFSSINSWKKLE